jgi:hypothetical protein
MAWGMVGNQPTATDLDEDAARVERSLTETKSLSI